VQLKRNQREGERYARRKSKVSGSLGIGSRLGGRVKPAIAQTPGATETSPFPGVVIRSYGEERSLIPGFKTVAMRDVILQPGAKTKEENEMMNAMVCHIAERELRIVQDGKAITAKKNYAWTCNTGTKEHVVNDSNAVAIMRITDLKA
jgi:hypothetical protein